MSEIIELSKEEPVVSHRVIAERTGNMEKSILDLITRYKEHFEEFGCLLFSDLKSLNSNEEARGRPSKVYYLNEQQATFLMTLLRNSDNVVQFKLRLVKEFFEMRKKIMEFEIIKRTVQLPPNREKLLDMYNPDFKKVFTKAVGKQKAEAIYTKIEKENCHDKTYEFITGFSKRWFLRGDIIYVQGSVDGDFKRYSTGLKNTDENIRYIDDGDNARHEFYKIHNRKTSVGI